MTVVPGINWHRRCVEIVNRRQSDLEQKRAIRGRRRRIQLIANNSAQRQGVDWCWRGIKCRRQYEDDRVEQRSGRLKEIYRSGRDVRGTRIDGLSGLELNHC